MPRSEISGEIGLPEKVLDLQKTFEDHGIAYALGGAIALAYHAEPRATDDIDVNILLTSDHGAGVVAALDCLFSVVDRDEKLQQISTRGQTRVKWGQTYIDLFFTDTAFHESIATRIRQVDFGGSQIPIISAEDLTVCKALFNRPHDWTDIARISLIQGDSFDRTYVDQWLRYFLGESDPILDHFAEI